MGVCVREDRSLIKSDPTRLTEDTSADFVHSLSVDGKKMLFLSNRTGKFEHWMKDLGSGREIPFNDQRGKDASTAR
jgi:Tol biopolymer transport system component